MTKLRNILKDYSVHNERCAPFAPFEIESTKDLKAITTDTGRLYNVGGRYLPSITTVLGKELPNVPEINKHLGAALGTRVHNLCEDYLLKGVAKTDDPISWSRFKPLIPFLNRVTQVIYIEQALYSIELGVAGRCDLVACLDNKSEPYIIDFKSLNSFKLEYIKDYFLQLQAYEIMLEELTEKKYNNWILACTTLEDGIQVKEINDLNLRDLVYKKVNKFYNTEKYKLLLEEVKKYE